MFDEIGQFVKHLAEAWGQYLSAIVALGAFTMAVLQTAKDLFPIRRVFQERFISDWLKKKCGSNASPAKAEQDLVALATDGDRHAFYDLAIEQLCGQMSAAAQIVLEYPGEHRDLLYCLTAATPKTSLDRLSAQRSVRATLESMKRPDGQGSQEFQELSDAKARTMHQVQRSIDGLQIAVSYRWKLWFQIASFVLSFVIAFIATYSTDWPFATRVFVGLTAGFLAPVARDLQARLQQVK